MHRIERNILHHAKQRKQLRQLIEQKDKKHFELWCNYDDIHKEFKLLCNSILNENVNREMLKGYAESYLFILNKK